MRSARLDPAEGSLLMIENVGNLVCPAAFDLGEAHKVVVLSVTEGEDKPLKYPDMFRAADLMLVNKIDLKPHVQFDVAKAVAYARRMRPALEVVELSATTGEGFGAWIAWLERGIAAAKDARERNVAGLRRRIAELEARAGGDRPPDAALARTWKPSFPPASSGSDSKCAGSCRAWASGLSCTGSPASSDSTAGCATMPRA